MVHFLVLAEFCEGDEKNIREFFHNRPYLKPPYKPTTQVREVKLMDFAVPEAVAESFLNDLGAQHIIDYDPEMKIRSGLIKAIRGFVSRFLPLEQVDMSKHIGLVGKGGLPSPTNGGEFAGTRSKFLVLGKFQDKEKDGKERF